MLDPQRLTEQYHGNKTLSADATREFRTEILDHYHTHPRSMAWRNTRDPYSILLSEFMLQQTQVDRVKTKYEQFLSAFPTLTDLAGAALPDVLNVWQGLGYNRRAVSLKRCAEEVVKRFGGQIPQSIPALLSLPGIGPYTARAVAAFAFDVPEPLIETNIRAVFIHFFFHGYEKIADQEILPLVAATLDQNNPRDWYYGLMDYGVMLKQTHSNPARRSNRHIKQSCFAGSNRQLRSLMLRALLASPGLTSSGLAEFLNVEQEAVEKNLGVMEREGFLEETGKRYQVRQHLH